MPGHSPARSVWRPDETGQQVRAERQQTAVASLHHELARVLWCVAKSLSEFHAPGRVLGVKCVGIFDEQVRVEQFLTVFSGLAVAGSAQRK